MTVKVEVFSGDPPCPGCVAILALADEFARKYKGKLEVVKLIGEEATAKSFDELLEPELAQIEDVGKMLAKDSELDSEPHRSRTCNLLIKSQLLCQLS